MNENDGKFYDDDPNAPTEYMSRVSQESNDFRDSQDNGGNYYGNPSTEDPYTRNEGQSNGWENQQDYWNQQAPYPQSTDPYSTYDNTPHGHEQGQQPYYQAPPPNQPPYDGEQTGPTNPYSDPNNRNQSEGVDKNLIMLVLVAFSVLAILAMVVIPNILRNTSSEPDPYEVTTPPSTVTATTTSVTTTTVTPPAGNEGDSTKIRDLEGELEEAKKKQEELTQKFQEEKEKFDEQTGLVTKLENQVQKAEEKIKEFLNSDSSESQTPESEENNG